jgi:phosphatidate cytidylyltransferase
MTRVVSGVGLAAVFFVLVWFTNATVLLFVALAVAVLAVHEYVQLFRNLGADMHMAPILVATWIVIANVTFPQYALEGVLSIVLLVLATWGMARLKPGPATADQSKPASVGPGFGPAMLGIATGILAPVYIGIGLGCLVAIHVWGGRGGVVLLMTTVIVSDTAQYYAGRTLGRHPLAPRLSPKKTIEGAVGGLLIAPAFLTLSAYYLVPAATNQLSLVLLGLSIVVAGIAGDLFESTLKRAAGMKDSSSLIPGHGGVLDRIDAMLFAAPLFYLYLRWLFA